MRYYKKNLLTVLVFLCANVVCAQDAAVDFVKINQAYQKHRKLSFNMDYAMYESHSSPKATKRLSSFTVQDSTRIFKETDSIITVSNTDYGLLIDQPERKIVISKQIQNKVTPEVKTEDMVEILKLCSKTEYIPVKNKIAGYMLYLPTGTYEKIAVYFNADSYLLTKLVCYIRTAMAIEEDDDESAENAQPKEIYPPRLEMICRNINTSPVIKGSIFDYNTYIEYKEGKFQGKGKYANYEVTDSYTNVDLQ